jgi:hypothetical protein
MTDRAVMPTERIDAMQYIILAYEDPTAFETRADPARQPAYYAAWMAYAGALREAGVLEGGRGLQPPQSATTVRLPNGKRQVQDGPFADSKEQLGGFFIIDVPDLDTALDWAARCPAAANGAIEVRPTMPPMPQA